MAKYLLIESRDPFTSADVDAHWQLATSLAREGDTVTLFLVQNGVLPARLRARSHGLAELAGAGVEVLADEFSLRERGIAPTALVAGVRPAPIDVVVDLLAEGRKAFWH